MIEKEERKLEAGLFLRAKKFFEEKTKTDSGKYFFPKNFFSFVSDAFFSGAAFLLEKMTGKRIYIPDDDELLPGISEKNKKIIVNFLKKGVLKKVIKAERIYCDEPKIIQYKCETSDPLFFSDGAMSLTMSAGTDIEEERALMKAVGEGLERFCLCVYRESNLLLSNFKKISKRAVNPLYFSGLSPIQREKGGSLNIGEKSIFRWTLANSIFEKEKKYIPAQLIYVGYKYAFGEPIIRQQISTGSALSSSLEGALYGGICEAVERDSFIINYLNKLSPPILDLREINDEDINYLLRQFKRYNLEIFLLDITTDIKIPSIMSIIIDRTGIGQAVIVTTKTDFSLKKAIVGAIFEGLQVRLNFREVLNSFDVKIKLESLKKDYTKINTFNNRCLLWSPLEMIDEIKFFLSGEKKIVKKDEFEKNLNNDDKKNLIMASNILKENHIDVFWADITIPQVREEGLWAIKAVSPQLQPLYLDEGMKHCWGERLFNVPAKIGQKNNPTKPGELNLIPHPFL